MWSQKSVGKKLARSPRTWLKSQRNWCVRSVRSSYAVKWSNVLYRSHIHHCPSTKLPKVRGKSIIASSSQPQNTNLCVEQIGDAGMGNGPDSLLLHDGRRWKINRGVSSQRQHYFASLELDVFGRNGAECASRRWWCDPLYRAENSLLWLGTVAGRHKVM